MINRVWFNHQINLALSVFLPRANCPLAFIGRSGSGWQDLYLHHSASANAFISTQGKACPLSPPYSATQSCLYLHPRHVFISTILCHPILPMTRQGLYPHPRQGLYLHRILLPNPALVSTLAKARSLSPPKQIRQVLIST